MSACPVIRLPEIWKVLAMGLVKSLIRGIPDDTKVLVVSLYDHGMSHGKQKFIYDGTAIIKKGALDKIEGPCPAVDAGRYKFKIAAVNQDGVIIGIGSRERYFPEEK